MPETLHIGGAVIAEAENDAWSEKMFSNMYQNIGKEHSMLLMKFWEEDAAKFLEGPAYTLTIVTTLVNMYVCDH